MSAGLLISRNTKLQLLKTSIASPTLLNITNYKTYRNLFQKVLREAKKKHITENLKKNQKNPKNTWKILNEVTGKCKEPNLISKININGSPSEDPLQIANEFNNFFVRVGKEISDGVTTCCKTSRRLYPC
jgi:hypothetical protein